jgi:hypothetical protein
LKFNAYIVQNISNLKKRFVANRFFVQLYLFYQDNENIDIFHDLKNNHVKCSKISEGKLKKSGLTSAPFLEQDHAILARSNQQILQFNHKKNRIIKTLYYIIYNHILYSFIIVGKY